MSMYQMLQTSHGDAVIMLSCLALVASWGTFHWPLCDTRVSDYLALSSRLPFYLAKK